jgi:inner membrane protein
MDPFTQGALGAALVQAVRRNPPATGLAAPSSPVPSSPMQPPPMPTPDLRVAGALGFLAAMAPDLDVLIRSSTDPLVFLQFHRHFTHALAFIPLGGLICALALHPFARRWGALGFAQTWLICTLGYATHGLLDAATSYGTSLLWPFSEARIAWSLVSVIDPLFTLPLAGLALAAWLKREALPARLALGWAALYMGAAAWQHNAALGMARALAAERGEPTLRVEVKPSFGNIVVWKSIAETPERFHVDAVRAGPRPATFPGASIPKLDAARDLPWLDPASRQARDIERFRVFSDGFIALDPAHPNRVVDVRYSFVPNAVSALWSIEVAPDAPADAHARYLTHRDDARAGMRELGGMMFGR